MRLCICTSLLALSLFGAPVPQSTAPARSTQVPGGRDLPPGKQPGSEARPDAKEDNTPPPLKPVPNLSPGEMDAFLRTAAITVQ